MREQNNVRGRLRQSNPYLPPVFTPNKICPSSIFLLTLISKQHTNALKYDLLYANRKVHPHPTERCSKMPFNSKRSARFRKVNNLVLPRCQQNSFFVSIRLLLIANQVMGLLPAKIYENGGKFSFEMSPWHVTYSACIMIPLYVPFLLMSASLFYRNISYFLKISFFIMLYSCRVVLVALIHIRLVLKKIKKCQLTHRVTESCNTSRVSL